jgi:hypothetical protein
MILIGLREKREKELKNAARSSGQGAAVRKTM